MRLWSLVAAALLLGWGIVATSAAGQIIETVEGGNVGRVHVEFSNDLPPLPDGGADVGRSADFPTVDSGEYRYVISPFAERIEHDECVPEEEPSLCWKLGDAFFDALSTPVEPLASCISRLSGSEHYAPESPLDDYAIGLQPIPDRPRLPLETNEKFLAPGFLEQGIRLPSGAIWRPAFWVFGTYRTGISYQDNRAGTKFTEWSNRLDLFGQLNLSGTERLLVGLRPLDRERGNRRTFASYDFRGGDWIDGANTDLQTFFFEGDFGEIFPNLDPYDFGTLDYGFSVGRQPMLFQQGLLVNEDLIDAVTVTRNTLSGSGNLNLRITGVYAHREVHRNNNQPDPDSQLIGLFTESDFAISTVNADVAYVNSRTNLADLVAFGLSAIQRLRGFHNTYNTSFHLLASFPTEGETAASGQGELLFSQVSWTPHHSNDLVYLNGFWAIDQFTSPARGPLAGGPLGQTGILFAAAGLGRFGAPLSNQASDAAGGSLGYQLFFDETRKQVVLEVGGRTDTNGIDAGEIGIGARCQTALDQHWIFIVDGFATKREARGVAPGCRVELLAKF
jgi:hypothetical protein